jgi:hypothetical protein
MIWRDEWRLHVIPIMKSKEEKKEKHQHQLNIVVGGKERRMDLQSSEFGSDQVIAYFLLLMEGNCL